MVSVSQGGVRLVHRGVQGVDCKLRKEKFQVPFVYTLPLEIDSQAENHDHVITSKFFKLER